jgi:hypothetical protein
MRTIVIFALAFLLTGQFVQAATKTSTPLISGTRILGTISTSTIWTADKSPYLLTGDLTIATGTMLTVEPGVSVGIGPFDFEISRNGIDGLIEKVSYVDLPVTPLMNATATLDIPQLGASATSSFLLSAPVLSVDVDGDGVADQQVKPNAPSGPVSFLESMKRTVNYLLATSTKRDGVIRRIDKLEDLARVGKISRLHDNTVRFSGHFSHRSIKGMTDVDRLTIVNMIDEFLGHLGAN